MSDIPPPPYEGRMSSLARLVSWMIPSLGVHDDQLRPDNSYVDRVLGAAYDIRLCEGIFKGWADHFDKARVEKPDQRERDVRRYIAWLTTSARKCSEDTDKIIMCHVHFAFQMASQIDGASKSGQNGLESDTDVARRIADLIATASDSLSQNVAKMKADLESFVSYLDNMQVKQEKSLLRKILGWLKYLFNALAAIFALGSCIAPLLRPVAPGLDLIAPAASALSLAAAELCKATIDSMEEKDAQSIESVLRFLKETVPNEAHQAKRALARFDAALVRMGIEEHMRSSRFLSFSRPDAAAIAQEWRVVAQRYQSVLPDNKREV